MPGYNHGAGGRTIEYTEEKKKDIIEKLNKYIDENNIPIIAEFAYQNDIRKATLYDIPEFSYCLRRLIEKKEANLEKFGLANEINISMATLSLKQIGWSEKQEINQNVNETIDLKINRDYEAD